jgi:hypothetical protein
VDEWHTTEIKEEKFIKALFLCLFLCTALSVDKPLQALNYVMYREIKPCGWSGLRGMDNVI